MKNIILDRDSILRLVTIASSELQKTKNIYEEIFFPNGITSPDVPEEYQLERIAMEEEFKKRHLVSIGSIVLATVKALLIINTPDKNTLFNFHSVLKTVFSNILKIRGAIISGKLQSDDEMMIIFDDSEIYIEECDASTANFSKRINELSTEIIGFIITSSDLSKCSNYFGSRMGQIFPDISLLDSDPLVYKITKDMILNLSLFFQKNYFDNLN